jgi:hypothetical protein
METITLVQTGKRYSLPLILIDEPGGSYWQHCLDFFQKELLKRGYINSGDFNLIDRVDSTSAAVAKIDRFYRRFHSLRYVNGRLIIRLKEQPSPEKIADLNIRFADILRPGGALTPCDPLPQEADEPELAGLPRLAADFNREDFGRLRRLIDALNED